MKKILVVDDDPNILELLHNRLESNGYEITEASNGIEAYASIQGDKPDLVILDVCMPTMDGYQLVREMKWSNDMQDIPILILSAREKTKNLFEAMGAVKFVSKPFDSDKLLVCVEQCLQEESAGG